MPPLNNEQPIFAELSQENIQPAANDAEYNQQSEYIDNNPILDSEWKEFINTGKISDERMYSLFYKIKLGAILSAQETQLYTARANEIEDLLKKSKETDLSK